MDIVAARTFLEIVKTGSFVRAATNLNITQTTISARVRVLEEQLDRQLFIRNKAGAKLTPAGDQFLRYATTLVQLWERARHDMAMPVGRENVVLVEQDAYYRNLADMPQDERHQANFDHPDSIDSEMMVNHIKRLKQGQPIEMPVYDMVTHTRSDRVELIERR